MLNKNKHLISEYFFETEVHTDSAVPSPPEQFGHIIVTEQFSTTYHQENDCNLTGQKEKFAQLGSSAIVVSSSDSRTDSSTSAEILAEALEETSAVDLGAPVTQRSSEKYESSSTDQAPLSEKGEATSPPPPCFGSQGQVVIETSLEHCEFVPEQKTNHTLYSITEDHSVAVEKPMCVGEAQRHLPPGDTSAMPCYSDSKNDPAAVQCLKEEICSTKEKNISGLKPCESGLSSEEKVDETQLQAAVDSIDYPVSCTEGCTTPPVVSITNLNCSVSETEDNQVSSDAPVAEMLEPQLQSQSSPTQKCTNVTSPLGSGDTHSLEPLKGKEEHRNGSTMLRPASTPSSCGSTTDNLPKFTSQRPDNLPTTMGRRSLPANWTLASSQR